MALGGGPLLFKLGGYFSFEYFCVDCCGMEGIVLEWEFGLGFRHVWEEQLWTHACIVRISLWKKEKQSIHLN